MQELEKMGFTLQSNKKSHEGGDRPDRDGQFADDAELNIRACHFPPGTSKWNKIEHRMFSVISMNWRGRPLTSVEVIVSLIAATSTKTGLKSRRQKATRRMRAERGFQMRNCNS